MQRTLAEAGLPHYPAAECPRRTPPEALFQCCPSIFDAAPNRNTCRTKPERLFVYAFVPILSIQNGR